jgi:hypothetical protein
MKLWVIIIHLEYMIQYIFYNDMILYMIQNSKFTNFQYMI